jgi:hypothetical protein
MVKCLRMTLVKRQGKIKALKLRGYIMEIQLTTMIQSVTLWACFTEQFEWWITVLSRCMFLTESHQWWSQER